MRNISGMQMGAGGNISPTSNIALTHTLMSTLTQRAQGLPGIGVLYGASGLGKSTGAAFASNPTTFNGLYVSCRSFETRKSLSEMICKNLGIVPKGNIPALVEAIIETLAIAQRPLIIDEVDHIAESRTLELLRDIHDASGAPLVLIGEEGLPGMLRKHERFDNRVLVWQPAALCSAKDVAALCKQYAPKITFAEDLQKRLLAECEGRTRRVVVNIENIKRHAEQQGITQVDATCAVKLYTGRAPGRGAA